MSIPTRVYAHAPVWVQHVLVSGYGAFLRYLRYGRAHRRELAALLESQWYPRDRLEDLQRHRLARLLTWAKHQIPYYAGIPSIRSRDPSTVLREVPLLTKAAVRAAGDQLLASSLRTTRHVVVHTGGTTGTPLTIRATRTAIQRNYAYFSRLRTWAGAPTGTRTATFAGRMVVPAYREYPYWRRNISMNTLLCSSYHLSDETVPHYARELARFGPALIDTYPSSIEPIARHLLVNDDVLVRPRAVITSSETLSTPTRERIERAFGCPVFDYYGAAEMAAFITQCEAGTYHVNPEFGIVEVLKDGEPVPPGEEGEIVATGFLNPVMPLIRYATGDLAVQGDPSPCPCGRTFPTIAAVVGRLDDVIVTPEGRRLGRLDPVFKELETIHEARIIQQARDRVRVEIVRGSQTMPAEINRMQRALAARLGARMSIDVVAVPHIDRTDRGKLRTVVNLLDANED